jgi:hypothetical protein
MGHLDEDQRHDAEAIQTAVLGLFYTERSPRRSGPAAPQDLLRMPGYETKMAAARNHVQSVVRQLRGHILGSRGKDHVIGLAVPDADMRCDVLQRKTPIPHFECE